MWTTEEIRNAFGFLGQKETSRRWVRPPPQGGNAEAGLSGLSLLVVFREAGTLPQVWARTRYFCLWRSFPKIEGPLVAGFLLI